MLQESTREQEINQEYLDEIVEKLTREGWTAEQLQAFIDDPANKNNEIGIRAAKTRLTILDEESQGARWFRSKLRSLLGVFRT